MTIICKLRNLQTKYTHNLQKINKLSLYKLILFTRKKHTLGMKFYEILKVFVEKYFKKSKKLK